jgi:hypothetical protein
VTTRRRVLAGLAGVGAAAALGTGVTVAGLRDGEALPPTVVASGDVRFVDCETGGRPAFDSLVLDLSAPGFAAEATLGPVGVATVPAWLVLRVCPPTGTVGGAPLTDYLDGTVAVAGAAPVPLGTVVTVPVDPGCSGDVAVTVAAALDAAGLDADGLAAAASGLSLSLAVEALLVQRTGVTAPGARQSFTDLFGACAADGEGRDDPPAGGPPRGPPPGRGGRP